MQRDLATHGAEIVGLAATKSPRHTRVRVKHDKHRSLLDDGTVCIEVFAFLKFQRPSQVWVS